MFYLNMDHLLVLMLLFWSSGLRGEEKHNSKESVRFVGGASRCAGMLEIKHLGEWRPVSDTKIRARWTPSHVVVVCGELDCGSAVSVELIMGFSRSPVWVISPFCVRRGSAASQCVEPGISSSIFNLTCSESVRLVNGSGRCSGRLEVKFKQSNHWSSVCEADFDQQDAEVVCRELSCGSPSLYQRALYGELETPMWSEELQCGGHESALMDCAISGPSRNTCSPGKAVGLTCLDSVRLVRGNSRCEGNLQVEQEHMWNWVDDLTLKEADVACRELGCGSAVSVGRHKGSSENTVWVIESDCVQSGSALRECALSNASSVFVHLTCSESVRLVNGPSLCSGRLEVKFNQSNHWSSVCEADFDQQDAEVVCRELGCGSPSLYQRALYGEVEAPMWTEEFQCGGHESALMDCAISGPARNTCSPGKAVGFTCLDPVRLVGGDSRCAGYLEVKQGDWKPVSDSDWTLKEAAFACRALYCGSAVSVEQREYINRNWGLTHADCVPFGSPRRYCTTINLSPFNLNLTCSELLLQPNISVSFPMDGVSQAQLQGFQVIRGSNFTISCAVEPEYPGGLFLLSLNSSNSAQNYIQPAVNHSANFLFPSAELTHQGTYSCDYILPYNLSFKSHLLSLTVLDPTPFIIKAVVLLLTLALVNAAMYIYCKASRRQNTATQEKIELDYYN